MKKLTSILTMSALGVLAIASQASAAPDLHPTVQNTPAQISAAVPEPGTWAMMIIGMAFLGLAMRRRSKAATV